MDFHSIGREFEPRHLLIKLKIMIENIPIWTLWPASMPTDDIDTDKEYQLIEGSGDGSAIISSLFIISV